MNFVPSWDSTRSAVSTIVDKIHKTTIVSSIVETGGVPLLWTFKIIFECFRLSAKTNCCYNYVKRSDLMTENEPTMKQDSNNNTNEDAIDKAIQKSESELNEGGELMDAKSALKELQEKHFG